MDTSRAIWTAVGYARVSREDGDRARSGSIVNQVRLLEDFVAARPDLRLFAIREDDGFSGVTFDRPGFQALLEDLKQGRADCVVVKDLSRLGRNYVEAGRYLEEIFPFLGARFLSIQDGYDSLVPASPAEQLLLPFRNLINDSYARDISLKVRSSREIRRRKGEFIGSFAPYGYRKDPQDRHRLVPDPPTAAVVREIFRLRLEGRSPRSIADTLTRWGVLSPLEDRHTRGQRPATPFQGPGPSRWSGVAVQRILSEETCAGALVQGKETTPSHKVRRRVALPEEQWARVEHAQEAVLPPLVFLRVRQLGRLDTRSAPGRDRPHSLAGLLVCGDCGEPMIHRLCRSGTRNLAYFLCAGSKYRRTCTRHAVREDALHLALGHLLFLLCQVLTDLPSSLPPEEARPSGHQGFLRTLQTQHLRERDHLTRLCAELEESLQGALLTDDERQGCRELCRQRLEAIQKALAVLEREVSSPSYPSSEIPRLLRQAEPWTEVPRPLAALLVENISVFEGRRVCIHLRFPGPSRSPGTPSP